jgi:hypothetical protein
MQLSHEARAQSTFTIEHHAPRTDGAHAARTDGAHAARAHAAHAARAHAAHAARAHAARAHAASAYCAPRLSRKLHDYADGRELRFEFPL